jgi:RHS repeat-associated protein
MTPALAGRPDIRRPSPLFNPFLMAGPVVMADDPCEAAFGGETPPGARKYYRARYYDPNVGRFISEDPLEPAIGTSPNLYAYAESNPIAYSDPTGLLTTCNPTPELTQSERDDLLVAFREILLNAMEHGARFDPEKVVEVSAIRTEDRLVFHVRDPGPGFRPDEIKQLRSPTLLTTGWPT